MLYSVVLSFPSALNKLLLFLSYSIQHWTLTSGSPRRLQSTSDFILPNLSLRSGTSADKSFILPSNSANSCNTANFSLISSLSQLTRFLLSETTQQAHYADKLIYHLFHCNCIIASAAYSHLDQYHDLSSDTAMRRNTA